MRIRSTVAHTNRRASQALSAGPQSRGLTRDITIERPAHVVLTRVLALIPLVLLPLACGSADEAHDRPNIILIMTDDQGWAQLGSHGDPVLQTPRLDAMAAESVEMTRFYVSPVCAPDPGRSDDRPLQLPQRASSTRTWGVQ